MNLSNFKINFHKTPENQAKTLPWHRLGRDPRTDWSFIVIVTIVIIGVLSLVGYSAYRDVEDVISGGSNVAVTSPHAPIDVNALRQVIQNFEARADVVAKVKNGGAVSPDPSL